MQRGFASCTQGRRVQLVLYNEELTKVHSNTSDYQNSTYGAKTWMCVHVKHPREYKRDFCVSFIIS